MIFQLLQWDGRLWVPSSMNGQLLLNTLYRLISHWNSISNRFIFSDANWDNAHSFKNALIACKDT